MQFPKRSLISKGMLFLGHPVDRFKMFDESWVIRGSLRTSWTGFVVGWLQQWKTIKLWKSIFLRTNQRQWSPLCCSQSPNPFILGRYLPPNQNKIIMSKLSFDTLLISVKFLSFANFSLSITHTALIMVAYSKDTKLLGNSLAYVQDILRWRMKHYFVN